MLKQVLSVTLFFSSISMAQVSKTGVKKTTQTDFSMAAEGLRVGVFKPNYELKFKSKYTSSFGSGSGTGSLDLDNSSSGLSIGYVSMPIRSIGFMTSANYIEITSEKSTNTLRLDGSGTYAFNKNVYSKAGLNFTQFVGRGAGDIDGDVGFQAGLGLQITPTIGFDLTYSQSNANSKYSEEDFSSKSEFSIQGIEMGVSATF